MDRAAPGAHRASACRTATRASSTLAFFADRVEGNLLAAHQEIQKLALLHPPGELSFEQIEAAVLNVARYDVFKLGEAVLAGQVARALRMLDGLRAEGEAAVLVHWTLAEDIRALKRVQGRDGQRQAAADGAARGARLGPQGAPVRARAAAAEPTARWPSCSRRPASATAWSRACDTPTGRSTPGTGCDGWR